MLLKFLAKEGGLAILEVDPGLVIWTFIIFGLVLLLLHRFAWGPIKRALDSRAKKIHENIKASERLKKEAEKILNEHIAKLDKLQLEAHKIIDDTHEQAKKERDIILDKAKAEALALLETSRQEIDEVKNVAMSQVEKHVIDLSIKISSQILRRRINPSDNEKLTGDAFNDIKSIRGIDGLESIESLN